METYLIDRIRYRSIKYNRIVLFVKSARSSYTESFYFLQPTAIHLRHIEHKSIYRAYVPPYIRHSSTNTNISNRIPYCAYVLPRIRYDSTNINMRLIDQDPLNALQYCRRKYSPTSRLAFNSHRATDLLPLIRKVSRRASYSSSVRRTIS